jgi:hypothetical protein
MKQNDVRESNSSTPLPCASGPTLLGKSAQRRKACEGRRGEDPKSDLDRLIHVEVPPLSTQPEYAKREFSILLLTDQLIEPYGLERACGVDDLRTILTLQPEILRTLSKIYQPVLKDFMPHSSKFCYEFGSLQPKTLDCLRKCIEMIEACRRNSGEQ